MRAVVAPERCKVCTFSQPSDLYRTYAMKPHDPLEKLKFVTRLLSLSTVLKARKIHFEILLS